MADIDLTQLAVDRSSLSGGRNRLRRHLFTRYLLPLALLAGFLSLLAWAARDIVLPPHAVTVMPVLATHSQSQREGTPLFKAAGWVEPRPTPVRVAGLAAGVVERLLVVQDQAVKAGDPVAELVKEDARLAHERAMADRALRLAEMQSAQAALSAAETRFKQPVHLDAAVGEANAALAAMETVLKNLPFETQRAVAQLEFARSNHEGKQAAQGTLAGRVIEKAKSELDTAAATVEELKLRVESLKNERQALAQRRDALVTQRQLLADETRAKDEAAAQVAAAQARLDLADVAVAEAKLRLDRMTVRAPVDGRVYRLVAEPGSRLMDSAGGSTPEYDASTVVTMYRPSSLQVRVDVRFEDLPKVQLGQVVEVDNPALDEPLSGKVLFISSEADIQKNTLQVKVEIDPPALFKPEMLVDVTFLAPAEPARSGEVSEELRLYVPQELLQSDDAGSFLWLADMSVGRARKIAVETASAGPDGMIEITHGLTAGSRLIVDGRELLVDNARIRIAGESGDHAAATHSGQRKTLDRLPRQEAR